MLIMPSNFLYVKNRSIYGHISNMDPSRNPLRAIFVTYQLLLGDTAIIVIMTHEYYCR